MERIAEYLYKKYEYYEYLTIEESCFEAQADRSELKDLATPFGIHIKKLAHFIDLQYNY